MEIPYGVKKLGKYSAWGLDCIKKVILPETVKSIGRMAFCDCKLKNVELPDTCQIEDAKSEPFGNADVIRYHVKAPVNPEVK